MPTILVMVVCLAALLPAVWPGAETWVEARAFRVLPAVLAAANIGLGIGFAQSRVAFGALLLAGVQAPFLIAGATPPPPAPCAVLLLLSGLYLPLLMVLFWRQTERGAWTPHGWTRWGMVALAVATVIGASHLPALGATLSQTTSPWWRPPAAWWPMPGAAWAALALALTLLALPIGGPRPLALAFGLATCLGMLALTTAGARGAAWPLATLGVSCAAAAQAVLTGAVLAHAWRAARLDELTGLPNRRSLLHHFDRLGETYAVALVDIDHFKRINDTHGHDIGDQALRLLAAHLRAQTAGAAYRYGGEEFAVVRDDGDVERFVADLESFRRDVAERTMGVRGADRPRRASKRARSRAAPAGATLTLTVSIGVARRTARHATPPAVLEAADKALYQAKEEGRNRLVVAR